MEASKFSRPSTYQDCDHAQIESAHLKKLFDRLVKSNTSKKRESEFCLQKASVLKIELPPESNTMTNILISRQMFEIHINISISIQFGSP